MWLYTLIPVAAAALGACYAALRPPGPKLTGAIQHFAAGIVFSAGAGELLPDLIRAHTAWPVVIGGGIGLAVMLTVRHFSEKAEGPASLIATAAIDVLVDGLVIGIGFAAGQKQGLLLTMALTVEILFLGLSVAGAFERGVSRLTVIGTTVGISLLLPLGSLAGGPIGSLPAPYMAGFFAFGLIALLYLVTEELLVEAHEKPDTPLVTAMFFVGFLLVTILQEMIGMA